MQKLIFFRSFEDEIYIVSVLTYIRTYLQPNFTNKSSCFFDLQTLLKKKKLKNTIVNNKEQQ